MIDLDDVHPEAVSEACRAMGRSLTSYGQTDMVKLSKRQFREMVKDAIQAYEEGVRRNA